MISVKDLFKENKYPKWISANPAFSKIEYVRKIFSTIGLPNFEEKQIIDNTTEITSFANQLLDLIADSLSERINKLESFSTKAKIGKKRRKNLSLLLMAMNSVNSQLRKDKNLFIVRQETGKISLAIPEDILQEDTVFLKKGAGLFKAYEKFNSILKENKFLPLLDLTKKHQFKNFSSINLPAKETIIKFSSEGADGIWDIATMSMRGINSCQTWDQGAGNSLKVIGSIIDPFTAIIYLTTSATFNQYGSKMVRRCIVRYVIDRASKEPFLLLEKMYPAFDQPSLDTFIKALQKRVPNIPIKYSGQMGERATFSGSQLVNVYIPLSDEMKMLEDKYYPYCDSHISFQEDASCKLAKNTTALHSLFKKRVPTLFEKAILSRAFTKETVKKYGAPAAELMSRLRSKKLTKENVEESKTNDSPSITELSNRFADFICNKTDSNPFHYLTEHENKCTEFFISEFGKTTNSEFAEFVASNVFDYIDEKSK